MERTGNNSIIVKFIRILQQLLQDMILIYTHYISTRLQYICKFIFDEQLGISHSITIDSESFINHQGPKINYSDLKTDDAFTIKNHHLLFETGIQKQDTGCFESNGYKAFFKSNDSDLSFDIFSASFYLLSRYEEYLPHDLDMYGRFAHENSLAFKEGFLHTPLVNIWILDFGTALKKKYPALYFKFQTFNFKPTYDIDIAYSYKYKGLLRNLGGFFKSPSMERLAVLSRLKTDPFDSYDYLHQLHKKSGLTPIYFFLVATSVSLYDKNISPYSNAMWQLIKRHAKKYTIGLHPSWKSNDNISIIKREKKILETAAVVPVKNSRQHYIKFRLPETFENLIESGIDNEYSMGYGSINGFRASVASSFFWYDLKNEKITALQLHPFCFMDANSFYEQKLSATQAYDEIFHYQQICKKVNGTFISIFHNNFLGTDKQFTGWKEMYTKFISQVPV